MTMKLSLKKAIIFFDLETTGTSITNDRIVEISLLKVMPNQETISRSHRINPGMPIPPEATAVHHISDADVASCPTFKAKAKEIAEFFKGCDIAGYNSNKFDVPMLAEEFYRAGVDFDFSKVNFIDVQTIFHKKEQRTLTAAYRFYCDKDLEGAHSAAADTNATFEVLLAQLDRYPDLPTDVEGLSRFSSFNRNVDLMGRIVYNDQGIETINFGKYKGHTVKEIFERDKSYFDWIDKGDFAGDTKRTFMRLYTRFAQEAKLGKQSGQTGK